MTSILDIVSGTAPQRTVLSEYHAAGAATGAFMIRKGKFKYVYYVGMPPQLFDLEADPFETRDLGRDSGYLPAAGLPMAAHRGDRRAGSHSRRDGGAGISRGAAEDRVGQLLTAKVTPRRRKRRTRHRVSK